MVAFKEGEKKGDARVLTFPDGIVFLNPGKPVVQFTKNFTKGFHGQISVILKDKKYNLYSQIQTGTSDDALICILGQTKIQTFNNARAEFSGETLAKVCGDVFTLPYMTEETVKDFITQVCALTTDDSNMPEKELYAKYNTLPGFDKLKVSASASVVTVGKTANTTEFPAIGSASVSASAFIPVPTSKRWGEISLTPEQKKKPEISAEAKAELDKLEAELSVKTKEITDNKAKFAELEKQVSSLRTQLAIDEAVVVKARNILNKKRELAILEAE